MMELNDYLNDLALKAVDLAKKLGYEGSDLMDSEYYMYEDQLVQIKIHRTWNAGGWYWRIIVIYKAHPYARVLDMSTIPERSNLNKKVKVINPAPENLYVPVLRVYRKNGKWERHILKVHDYLEKMLKRGFLKTVDSFIELAMEKYVSFDDLV